jgi:hypothetical protein
MYGATIKISVGFGLILSSHTVYAQVICDRMNNYALSVSAHFLIDTTIKGTRFGKCEEINTYHGT